jgi:excisionase family DNA binding protein
MKKNGLDLPRSDNGSFGIEFFDNLKNCGRLLTIRELADILKVSKRTIEGWVYRRKIESIKIGPSLIRFDPEYVARWILQRKGESNYGN